MLSEANGLPVTNSQVSEELELLLEKTKERKMITN